MTTEADAVAEPAVSRGPSRTTLWQLPRLSARPMGWALADQAVSSLTNFAVVFYVAHAVGANQFGAFSLAYVTYSFALALSRGLATSPLQVRFSGVELQLWRRAVANCTGTAWAAGIVTGACVLLAGTLLDGTAKGAFIALGLTLPGLLLQDSWRFAFFSLGRGSKALLNDTVWALGLLLGLALLRLTGHEQVFWFVLVWGLAANVAAFIGSLQARIVPRLSGLRDWISRHRDLGFRYVAEEASINGAGQLRTYGVGLIAGLAAVGYLQAATTVMGPFMVIFLGASLVTVPEAVRALSHSLFAFAAVLDTCWPWARNYESDMGNRTVRGISEGARGVAVGLNMASYVPTNHPTHNLSHRSMLLRRCDGGLARSWSRKTKLARRADRIVDLSRQRSHRGARWRSLRRDVRCCGGDMDRRCAMVVPAEGRAGRVRQDARQPRGVTPGSALEEDAISLSGGDSRVASNYVGQMLISGNVLTDNWGGVILWENADRNCSHRSDDACTLVDPSMYTLSSCGANLSEKSPVDNLDPADVAGSGSAQCTVANLCGFNGLFSNYGTRIYGDTPRGSHIPTTATSLRATSAAMDRQASSPGAGATLRTG